MGPPTSTNGLPLPPTSTNGLPLPLTSTLQPNLPTTFQPTFLSPYNPSFLPPHNQPSSYLTTLPPTTLQPYLPIMSLFIIIYICIYLFIKYNRSLKHVFLLTYDCLN